MGAPLASPEKELRFTRSAQALGFWIAGGVLGMAGILLLVNGFYRQQNPQLPHPCWAMLPLVAACFSVRLAVGLTRHAYLILTPLGLEIFPFFRPTQMQMVAWQEIHAAEVNAAHTLLTLHFNPGKTAGIRLSLKPIRADRRSLLAKAVLGRLSPPASRG